MTITAKQVSELRSRTGVGLMACKQALMDVDGNIDMAIKKLREKGLAKAAKTSDRSVNEGRVFVARRDSDETAVIIELNCETDFVASNDVFSECGQLIANAVLEQNLETIDHIESLRIGDDIYKDFISKYVLRLGENINLKQFVSFSGASCVSQYVHMNGKIGVLVAFSESLDRDLATGVAMHVAAANPTYLKREDVVPSELEHEKDIIRTQSIKEGKPEAIVEKIVEGRIGKYYKEVCLLEQAYIKDDKQTIQQILPANVQIERYVRFSLSM